MNDAVYRIVEHDGGWAYKLGDVFSETFPDRLSAESAARRVAEEQRIPGEDEAISWEDERGTWHDEAIRGSDRPNAYVAEALRSSPRGQPSNAAGRHDESWKTADHARPMRAGTGRFDKGGLRWSGTQIRSDSLVAMLLTIAVAHVLSILVGRKP